MFRLPYISKAEARVCVCCAVMIFTALALWIGIEKWGKASENEGLTDAQLEEVERFNQSILVQSRRAYGNVRGAHLADHLFPFDPNRADSATLLRLGLSEWQVANMLKYRRKGGRWRSALDLARLYGLSAADFKRLRPFIRIAPSDRRKEYAERDEWVDNYGGTAVPDYERVEKYADGTLVGLNTADTTELKRIPGIGRYYARKIVAYRERLGGFVSVRQVNEIEGLPPGISRWFVLGDSVKIRKIRINRDSFKTLVRHPYLSYEQTKAIVNYVRQYGRITSWRALSLYEEFTEDDFLRLTPYVSFE